MHAVSASAFAASSLWSSQQRFSADGAVLGAQLGQGNTMDGSASAIACGKLHLVKVEMYKLAIIRPRSTMASVSKCIFLGNSLYMYHLLKVLYSVHSTKKITQELLACICVVCKSCVCVHARQKEEERSQPGKEEMGKMNR